MAPERKNTPMELFSANRQKNDSPQLDCAT